MASACIIVSLQDGYLSDVATHRGWSLAGYSYLLTGYAKD